MFDFGVSFSEIFLISVVALLILGPEDFPKALRHTGRAIGHIKKLVSQSKAYLEDLSKEIDVPDKIFKDPPLDSNLSSLFEKYDEKEKNPQLKALEDPPSPPASENHNV